MSRGENPAPTVAALVARRAEEAAGLTQVNWAASKSAMVQWLREAATALQAESERADRAERAHVETAAERDDCHEWADKLARAIGGAEVGEHSNLNHPWSNALEMAQELHARADREKARADLFERQYRQASSDHTSAMAALTACRQDTVKLIAEAVAAERADVDDCLRVCEESSQRSKLPGCADIALLREALAKLRVLRARTTGGSDHGE